MEGGPLLQDWWVKMASEDFVPYLNISTRLRDTPDQGMLQRMGGRGFPYFVVLDPGGNRVVPGRAYPQFRPMNEKGTQVALVGAQELIAARKTAAEDPKNAGLLANVTLLEALLLQGTPSADRVEKAKSTEGVDRLLVQRVEIQAILRTYSDQVRGLPRGQSDARQEAYDIAARKMLKLHRSGTPLNDVRLRVFSDYWRLVFDGALLEAELEIAETALSVYRRVFSTSPEKRQRIDVMTQRLEEMKKTRDAGKSSE